jgi:hypothetical protein
VVISTLISHETVVVSERGTTINHRQITKTADGFFIHLYRGLAINRGEQVNLIPGLGRRVLERWLLGWDWPISQWGPMGRI